MPEGLPSDAREQKKPVAESTGEYASPSPARRASKVIFIGYASEGSKAACRIANVLRHGGIDVWLDQHDPHSGELFKGIDLPGIDLRNRRHR